MEKPKQPEQVKEIQKEANASVVVAPENTSSTRVPVIGAYGPQAAPQVELSRKAWDATNHRGRAWSEDPKSRMAVRMFSRGLLGAVAFTAGGMLAKKWMNGYDATLSISRQGTPLKFLAKTIDTVIGKPIEAMVTAVAGKELGVRSVRFRGTHFNDTHGSKWGRSLGEEMNFVTFDFFSASIGDAIGRDLAAIADPNEKKSFIDKDGHISADKALKSVAKAAWKYVSYNGGEDWAVALPYVYFMKGQRSLINKASPGFKYDFDRNLNGGAFKLKSEMGANGLKEYKTAGNYNIEGVLDLQSRFTAYNIGTLMYREAYDAVAQTIKGKPVALYGAVDENAPPKSIVEKLGNVAKWVARSAVKGVLIMTPSVPFFWITRTPQTNHRGTFIHPEDGQLTHFMPDGKRRGAVHANDLVRGTISENEPFFMSRHNENLDCNDGKSPHVRTQINHAQVEALQHGKQFNAYHRSYGPIGWVMNQFGSGSYWAAGRLDEPAKWLDAHTGNGVKDALNVPVQNGARKWERFTRPAIYASMSYTPYMIAKAEFANMWDDGKMDYSAERLIDGATKLNWSEFKKGAHDIYNTMLLRPLEDPAREAEGQRRKQIDTSAPDVFTETQAQQVQSESNWRERIISGSPVEKKIIAERDEKKAPQKKASYAEQQSMRKALEELSPPTNAIN